MKKLLIAAVLALLCLCGCGEKAGNTLISPALTVTEVFDIEETVNRYDHSTRMGGKDHLDPDRVERLFLALSDYTPLPSEDVMGITLTDPDDKDEPEEYLRLESEIRKELRHATYPAIITETFTESDPVLTIEQTYKSNFGPRVDGMFDVTDSAVSRLLGFDVNADIHFKAEIPIEVPEGESVTVEVYPLVDHYFEIAYYGTQTVKIYDSLPIGYLIAYIKN